MRKTHANHGRDHLPTGADPIPEGFSARSCLGCFDVPIEFQECAQGALDPFMVAQPDGDICGVGETVLIAETLVNRPCLGNSILLDDGVTPALEFQVKVAVATPIPSCTDIVIIEGEESQQCYSNFSNVIVYAGAPGFMSQMYAPTWPVAGSPGAMGTSFESDWVAVPISCSGCEEMAIGLTFTSHSSFTGGCATGGVVLGRWVPLGGDGEGQTALDEFPPGEQQNDVVHFNSRTKEFVVGPSSVPSRAIATFFG